MRYPEFLNKNGTIGFVAPAFGCATQPYRDRFDRAQEIFRQQGYTLKLGDCCYEGTGTGISSSPEKCARELMDFYCAEDCDVLLSCGGGELMCETISQVDFDRIRRAEPKWYMGYSDNTNFTFLLTTLCDTAAVYGPNVGSFGMNPWHPYLNDAMSVLKGEKKMVSGYENWEKESLVTEETPFEPLNTTQERILKLYIPPRGETWKGINAEEFIEDARYFHGNLQMEGRLTGGCMDCLVNLTGTRFDQVKEYQKRYEKDGFIWFLEACDLNVFAIRRAMWQMEEAGWFENVRGFLIGRPLCHGQEMMGLDAYEAVLSIARKHKVPVVMDADLGHLPPQMPIVSGSMCRVEISGNDICLNYEFR